MEEVFRIALGEPIEVTVPCVAQNVLIPEEGPQENNKHPSRGSFAKFFPNLV